MDAGKSPQLADSPWLNPTWDRVGNLLSMSFVVVGTPKPKARARTVRNPHTGYTHTYTPHQTVDWEQTIVWQAKQAMIWADLSHPGELAELLPLDCRLALGLRFNLLRPKSLPKKVEYPMKGADIDNFEKSVLDALQIAQLIKNDKTVTDTTCMKRFAEDGHPEGVEIDITAWL